MKFSKILDFGDKVFVLLEDGVLQLVDLKKGKILSESQTDIVGEIARMIVHPSEEIIVLHPVTCVLYPWH